MGYKATNNAYALLASAITAGATTLTVQSGYGDKFPAITSPDFTLVTLENSSGEREIVKVTARSLGQDVMTIERAQEGTIAAAWSAGDVVECRPTAGIVQRAIEHIDNQTGAHNASAIAVTPAGNIASTNVQDALAELDSEKLSSSNAGSVQTINIANEAVTSQKIADGAVTSQKIADGAVTSQKIADGAVTNVKMGLSSWSFAEVAGVLYFKHNGVNKMKLDSSGNLICTGDVKGFGVF